MSIDPHRGHRGHRGGGGVGEGLASSPINLHPPQLIPELIPKSRINSQNNIQLSDLGQIIDNQWQNIPKTI